MPFSLSHAFKSSDHFIYNHLNNSVYCNWTGLWYPAGNFSLASLNLTSSHLASNTSGHGHNYTTPYSWAPSHASNSSWNATTVIKDPPAGNSTTTDPVANNTITYSNTTGSSNETTPELNKNNSTTINHTSYDVHPYNVSNHNISSPFLLPFANETSANTSSHGNWNGSASFNGSVLPDHLIYNPTNNSIYCNWTGLWYPRRNFSLPALIASSPLLRRRAKGMRGLMAP